jgi:putative ATPase
MDLFGEAAQPEVPWAPLAVRMTPRTLEEFVGQEHILGEGKLLRRMLRADRLSSLIFYGPPGTGKTALAHVIANTTQAAFEGLNASSATVADVRQVLGRARDRLHASRRTVLFIDELHRFNRAQQDVLLPDVEQAVVILIGATTQNPFFAINAPLVSRSQIFQFEPLGRTEVRTILERALADRERGLGQYQVRVTPQALDHLVEMSDGDARRALSALEVGVLSAEPDTAGVIHYDLDVAAESIQRKAIVYDGTGDEHYDAASAFIKSMRGSDPDAALYWMAKMLEAGEDPRFIARRIVICAAEDVGNAEPQALQVATAAMQAAEFVGLPEARIILAQAVTFIACAPKSNASYLGIARALDDVENERTVPVPKHLRGTGYRGAARLGHGVGYQYAHEGEGHWVDQEYLGVEKTYYEPTDQGFEARLKARLEELRRRREQAEAGAEPKGVAGQQGAGQPGSVEPGGAEPSHPEGGRKGRAAKPKGRRAGGDQG